MFLGTLPCPARRAFISRFFSQNRSFTMRTLFLTSKAKNRFFKKNVFLTPNVCSFDPSGGGGYFTPPMPPTITRPTLNTRNESFMFPIENVLLTLRTDNQADNFFSKTLLYEKENIFVSEISKTGIGDFHRSLWSTNPENFRRFGNYRCNRGRDPMEYP